MSHDWQDVDAFKGEYTHPLWRDHGQQAIELGGHGGMDFILNFRLIQVRPCPSTRLPLRLGSTRPLVSRRVAFVA